MCRTGRIPLFDFPARGLDFRNVLFAFDTAPLWLDGRRPGAAKAQKGVWARVNVPDESSMAFGLVTRFPTGTYAGRRKLIQMYMCVHSLHSVCRRRTVHSLFQRRYVQPGQTRPPRCTSRQVMMLHRGSEDLPATNMAPEAGLLHWASDRPEGARRAGHESWTCLGYRTEQQRPSSSAHCATQPWTRRRPRSTSRRTRRIVQGVLGGEKCAAVPGRRVIKLQHCSTPRPYR
jgi:hypothetical protein